MSKTKTKRMFITTADVMVLTDKSYSTCYNLLRTIKDALEKKPKQDVSIEEYANYVGQPVEKIEKQLGLI